MKKEKFFLKNESGEQVKCVKWSGLTAPLAIIQVVHGMAEHSERYQDFAQFLVNKGFDVYASDHRGHGETAGSVENTGFFAKNDGWNAVSKDIFQLTKLIKNKNENIPIYLFGHSMGSFLVRYNIANFPEMIEGAIISATSYTPKPLIIAGQIIAKFESLFFGGKHRSKVLNHLSFGAFNRNFKPFETDFDWLSRDKSQVEKYINDEFCGFICTSSFFSDLFFGMWEIQKTEIFSKTPKNLPILFISGEMDPVGNFSKSV